MSAPSAKVRSVPLKAGIGPENPPCPACGEPLFGWVESPADHGIPIRRCESCGLGVVGEPGGAEEALAELDGLRVRAEGDPRYRFASRSSFQSWLGGRGWALLDGHPRHLFTPTSASRLVALRDQQVTRSRWLPGASLLGMWATLLNSFTFGRNVAIGSLGRATALPAARGWQRALDGFVSVALALPVMVVAIPLELGGGLARRGGVVELTVRLE